MAVDSPSAPQLTLNESSRTLNSVELLFASSSSNGGSDLFGYQLWRNEGISGSPFTQIFDGTGRPEVLSFVNENLHSSLTYTFRLYAMNRIHKSDTYASLVVEIGVVPSKPGQPEYLNELYSSGSMTLQWTAPESEGAWPVTSYDVWVDDGAGNWPSDALTVLVGDLEQNGNNVVFTISGLVDSTTYGFKVQAANSIGLSEESNTQYFVCAQVPSASAAGPSLESSTDSEIVISWNAPSYDGGSPITGYKVFMNPLNEGDWQLSFDGTGQPTVHTAVI